MGKASPKFKKTAMSVGSSSSNPHRKMSTAKVNGGEARTKAKINILNMYRNGKAIRNKRGQLVGGEYVMATRAGGKEIDSTTGRVAPDRRFEMMTFTQEAKRTKNKRIDEHAQSKVDLIVSYVSRPPTLMSFGARRWFGNTRTVAAAELDKFREEMRLRAADPYR